MNSNNEQAYENGEADGSKMANQSQNQRPPQLQQYENPHQQHQLQPQTQLEGKRQYGCPCGKTYLSYPALFTHVKQKHDGRAPGKLIKPKTDKARGRPKIHVQVPQDDMSDGALNLQEELQAALLNINLNYQQKIQTSEGYRTCQDMATAFINKVNFLQENDLKIIHCYLNLLREVVCEKFGDKYWKEERPNQIIDLVNDMCKTHENYKEKFPIEKQVLISLTYVLFRWMYKTKWTDHKLIRRSTSNVISKI